MPENAKQPRSRIFAAAALLLTFAAGVFCQRVALLDPVEESIKSVFRPLYVKKWPTGFQSVTITSSADRSAQKAMVYRSTKKSSPLIVSLHTWSGNWATPDPLAPFVEQADWNYIYPDFRGPNNRPEACLGPSVVSDIDDAIRFGLKELNADKNNVAVVGMSGGGHAALGHLLSSDGPAVKAYSAWCPITDLEAWFHQLKARNLDSDAVAKCCGDGQRIDTRVAIERSPVHMDFDKNHLKDCEILIRAGILDGTVGKVPYSHSVKFFNRCCAALGLENDRVTDREQASIGDAINRQWQPHAEVFSKGSANVNLSLFFGHHEFLPEQAIEELEKKLAANTIQKELP